MPAKIEVEPISEGKSTETKELQRVQTQMSLSQENSRNLAQTLTASARIRTPGSDQAVDRPMIKRKTPSLSTTQIVLAQEMKLELGSLESPESLRISDNNEDDLFDRDPLENFSLPKSGFKHNTYKS